MDLAKTIEPDELMCKFGDNTSAAIAYVKQVHGLKTKEAKELVENLYAQNQELLLSIWAPTKTVGVYFQVDDNHKRWAPLTGLIKTKPSNLYNYSDILEYELIEDGDTLTEGGLGRAVVGGALLGGVGALVGGMTGKRKSKKVVNSLSIKITTKNIENPVVYINLITAKTKTSSLAYKVAADSAQEILSILAQIIMQNEAVEKDASETETEVSAADEIRKYKQLLDDSIITQEEFDSKKKQLLGL